MVFVPFINKFTILMAKILPEETHNPNRFLDNMLYRNPTPAIDTVERGVFEIFQKTIVTIHKLIHKEFEKEGLSIEKKFVWKSFTLQQKEKSMQFPL
jgi:Na+/phosphate symporter